MHSDINLLILPIIANCREMGKEASAAAAAMTNEGDFKAAEAGASDRDRSGSQGEYACVDHSNSPGSVHAFGLPPAMIPPFETTFAVPLSCEDCIKAVSTSLYKIDGKPTLSHATAILSGSGSSVQQA